MAQGQARSFVGGNKGIHVRRIPIQAIKPRLRRPRGLTTTGGELSTRRWASDQYLASVASPGEVTIAANLQPSQTWMARHIHLARECLLGGARLSTLLDA